MPSIYGLKPAFQKLLRPLVGGLVRMGVVPNHVTWAALLLSGAVGTVVALRPDARWPLLLLPGTLFVRMALNALDGMMAREHDLKTTTGLFLNELGDVLADAALYLPLSLRPEFSPLLVVPIAVLSVVSEMAGVVAVQAGASRRYDGPMGKSDRAFVFGAVALALGLGAPAGTWLTVLLAIVLALVAVTIWNRARKALAEIAA